MPLLGPPVALLNPPVNGGGGTTGGGGTGTGGTGGGGGLYTPPAPLTYSGLTWVSPNGSTWDLWDLTDALFVNPGITGFGAAPRSLIADLLPDGGSLVRNVIPQPRMVTLPLYLGNDDVDSFLDRFRLFTESFTCTDRLGPGQLIVSRSDGSARQLSCLYYAGFDDYIENGFDYTNVVVQLYAADPFWTSQATTQLHFGASTSFGYLTPYLTVGASQILGESTITIAGSRPAYPVWTFTGPFTSVMCSRGSDSFTITRDAVAGEVWTVNTTPGLISATSGDSTNLFPYLNFPDANLWALNPGDNDINLVLTGNGPGSSVALSYQVRSETA